MTYEDFERAQAAIKRTFERKQHEQAEVEEAPDPDVCHYCYDDGTVTELDWVYGLDHILPGWTHCPMCGREVKKREGKAE
jgi:hypothetical protein